MTQVLRVSDLSRSFGTTTVLAGVNLSLAAGERLAVIGPSGSGKTTLLRLIAGLDAPSLGEVDLAGEPVSRRGRLLVPPERRNVAMVFQGLALIPHLRALDQVAFAARDHGGRQRARQLLDRVGLGHRSSAALDQLSGGERQRIALARALAQQPALLLMDEPFASLDDERRAEMRGLLRALLDETGTTLILVTHSRDDALDLATRVLVLHSGRPVACDTLAGMLARPGHVAAVRCLALGELIEGETPDGLVAKTPFGLVALTHRTAPGRVRLLVRPGQPVHTPDGAGYQVISMEVRPPQIAEEVRRFAVVRSNDHILRVEIRDDAIAVGQSVGVRIEGSCQVLEG